VLFIGTGGLTHDLPGFYPADEGADLTEEERIALYARLNVELRVPGRTFGPEWDLAFLDGIRGTDRAWLDDVGRDVSLRGGNGANEVVSWVAAWAATGEPLDVLTHRFDAEYSNGVAVAVSRSPRGAH
jgi:2,3-dihydroxyphenylpropionate 1,2-dioxygenase